MFPSNSSVSFLPLRVISLKGNELNKCGYLVFLYFSLSLQNSSLHNSANSLGMTNRMQMVPSLLPFLPSPFYPSFLPSDLLLFSSNSSFRSLSLFFLFAHLTFVHFTWRFLSFLARFHRFSTPFSSPFID